GYSGSAVLPTAEILDVSANTWSFTTNKLTTGRSGHAAARQSDGKVLVAGGSDGSSPLKSAEVYDPASGLWGSEGTMSVARENPTATLLLSGKILVTGGTGTTGNLPSAEIYDPIAKTWTSAGTMSASRSFHTATRLLSGQVLVVGGFNGQVLPPT